MHRATRSITPAHLWLHLLSGLLGHPIPQPVHDTRRIEPGSSNNFLLLNGTSMHTARTLTTQWHHLRPRSTSDGYSGTRLGVSVHSAATPHSLINAVRIQAPCESSNKLNCNGNNKNMSGNDVRKLIHKKVLVGKTELHFNT